MTAFLGMYDPPRLHAANDAFWSAIRARLGFGPARLDRETDPWQIWRDPGLVLAQTCGMPYRTYLHDTVQLVGTPDYALPGCAPGYYNSVMITASAAVGLDAGAPVRMAYNDALSQSGWAAPIGYLMDAGLRPAAFIETGSHLESARAVAGGRADIAGIDALTWELIRDLPELAGLREIARTPPTPGLPFVTSAVRDACRIAAAVDGAIDDLSAGDRAALHLNGLVSIPAEAYLAIPTPLPPDAYSTA